MAKHVGSPLNNRLLMAAIVLNIILSIILLYVWPSVTDFSPLKIGLRDFSAGVLGTVLTGALGYFLFGFFGGRQGPAESVGRAEAPPPDSSADESSSPILAALPEPALNAESLANSSDSNIGVRTFFSEADLQSVTAIDFMAVTGSLQVKPICELIERMDCLHDRSLKLRILFRGDSSSDTRRIKHRKSTLDALERAKHAMPGLDYEVRYYSAPSALRAMILRHTDDTFSAHLSFYDWRSEDKMSVRESEVPWCYPRTRVTAEDKLLSLYRSWFAQWWGKHRLHTILFDFDDTLFRTMNIQVRAWMHALRRAIDCELITETMIAQEVREVLHDDKLLHSRMTEIVLSEQQESNMLDRLFPTPLHEARVTALRSLRLPRRDADTIAHAVPFHELTQHLPELCGRYQLVVVSATSEATIRQVLKDHNLASCFSHIFGKEALHRWQDVEGKTPNFVRASNMLGIPLERMAFVGDSEADFLSARQLGITFIESRLNARSYELPSLIHSRAPHEREFVVDANPNNGLLAVILQVEEELGRLEKTA